MTNQIRISNFDIDLARLHRLSASNCARLHQLCCKHCGQVALGGLRAGI